MQNENPHNREKTKALLNSEYLTEPTRQALRERLLKVRRNSFFDHDSFLLLSVVCDLLMDQDSEDRMVQIALFIDERLLINESDGWRYDSMPPDRIMYTNGLQGIDEVAWQQFGKRFIALEKKDQLQVLNSIQEGDVETEIWKQLDPKLFFEEVLAETAEIFFSHPEVQASINYVGMADAKGWTKLKLNQSEHLENLENDQEHFKS